MEEPTQEMRIRTKAINCFMNPIIQNMPTQGIENIEDVYEAFKDFGKIARRKEANGTLCYMMSVEGTINWDIKVMSRRLVWSRCHNIFYKVWKDFGIKRADQYCVEKVAKKLWKTTDSVISQRDMYDALEEVCDEILAGTVTIRRKN